MLDGLVAFIIVKQEKRKAKESNRRKNPRIVAVLIPRLLRSSLLLVQGMCASIMTRMYSSAQNGLLSSLAKIFQKIHILPL